MNTMEKITEFYEKMPGVGQIITRDEFFEIAVKENIEYESNDDYIKIINLMNT